MLCFCINNTKHCFPLMSKTSQISVWKATLWVKSEQQGRMLVWNPNNCRWLLLLRKQRFGLVFACAFPIPRLTDPHLQARALRFFMPDKSSTTTNGTQCEWSAAVKTSNSLWMTTWLKVSFFFFNITLISLICMICFFLCSFGFCDLFFFTDLIFVLISEASSIWYFRKSIAFVS